MDATIRREYWKGKYPSQVLVNLPNANYGELFNLTQTLEWQPPIQYRVQFIKAVIKRIERDPGSEDQLDLWYSCLEKLTQTGVEEEPFYRLYDPADVFGLSDNNADGETCQPIKIFEDEKSFVVDGSTGFVTWNACLELGKWLISSPDLQKKQCDTWCYELGAGTGMMSILLARKLKLVNCTATDCHEGVVERCRQNVDANSLTNSVHTRVRDWTLDKDLFRGDFKTARKQFGTNGILLGADIVFDERLLQSLVAVVKTFFDEVPQGLVFISSTIRNPETYKAFTSILETEGMKLILKYGWSHPEGSGEIVQILHNVNPS